jgi:heterodisulfide reductase subunit A-like polyferredoxin
MRAPIKPRPAVGGGIGGLSAALALARKGIPVQVLEQAPEFKEIGAASSLDPTCSGCSSCRIDRADVPLVRFRGPEFRD